MTLFEERTIPDLPKDKAGVLSNETLVYAGNLDVDAFTGEINRLMKIANEENWGVFQLYEPKNEDADSFTLPTITYDITGRCPSKTHKSPDPILFNTEQAKDGSVVKIYRQWFDAKIVFSTYHKTNRQAIDLQRDFENMLRDYKDYFKNKGLSELSFENELAPISVTIGGDVNIACRRLVYNVRLEQITTARANTIKDLQTPKMISSSPLDDSFMDYYAAQNKKQT